MVEGLIRGDANPNFYTLQASNLNWAQKLIIDCILIYVYTIKSQPTWSIVQRPLHSECWFSVLGVFELQG